MADLPPPYYDDDPGMEGEPNDEDEIAKAVAAAAEYMRQSTYDAYARADIN